MSKNTLVYRRLYRSLLKASAPFSSPSPNAAIMSCLLHRTGFYDTLDTFLSRSEFAEENLDNNASDATISMDKLPDSQRMKRSIEEARDLSKSYAEEETSRSYEDDSDEDGVKSEKQQPDIILFRRLLREVLNGDSEGNGLRKMQFPSQVDTSILPKILRREFRRSYSSKEELQVRRQVAFIALKALNLKLGRADRLQRESFDEKSPDFVRNQLKHQAAKYVTPLLSSTDNIEHLVPGTFLVAHPQMTGYFRRSVIILLDRSDDKNGSGGTYGLILNRSSNQTLSDVLRIIPEKLRNSPIVDTCSVRDGGPVHMSVQMIHALHGTSSDINEIGGTVLQHDDKAISSTLNSDRSIHYQGDIFEAAQAVESGAISVDDVCFYVGASCWEVGQLENEIESGYWIPCRAPPEIALTGKCETMISSTKESTKEFPLSEDLWLSIMSALGPDEAMLAYWHCYSEDIDEDKSFINDDDDEGRIDDSAPCDIF